MNVPNRSAAENTHLTSHRTADVTALPLEALGDPDSPIWRLEACKLVTQLPYPVGRQESQGVWHPSYT